MKSEDDNEIAKGIAMEVIAISEINSCREANKGLKYFFIISLLISLPSLFFFLHNFNLFFLLFPLCSILYLTAYKLYGKHPLYSMSIGGLTYFGHTLFELLYGFIPLEIIDDHGDSFRNNGKGMFGEIVLIVIPIIYMAIRMVLILYFIKWIVRIVKIRNLGRYNDLIDGNKRSTTKSRRLD